MKRIFWIASIFMVACLSSYGQDNSDDQNNDDVYYQDDNNNTAPAPQATDGSDQAAPTYQQFYDQLSPYGQWINYPGYGYCWVPNQLPPDFSPYMTGGHWVYTDFGMTWVSDYDWGWACFHYGRWFDDASYGWMWMPGYDWAPAWCVWGNYGDYYCWAPIGPGVIISPHYRPNPNWWHFVNHEHMMDEHIDHYNVKHEDIEKNGHIKMDDINNHISVISHANTYNQGVFFSGPKSEEIQKYTGHPVTKVVVSNTAHPGATHVQNNQLNIYRPNIQRTTHQPAPSNVKNVQDVHPNNNKPNNEVQHGNAQPQRAVQQPRETTQPQKPQQQWTPPRQSQPRPAEQQQPVRQQQPVQRAPERNFIPSEPAPHYSAPVQRSFSPAPSFHPSGGGGRR